MDPVEAPTRSDPVAAALSEMVGGPVGEHAAGHPWWSPTRVLLGATALVLGAGMLSKGACVSSGWSKDTQPYAELCWTSLAGRPADSSTPPHVATWLESLAGLFPGSGTVSTTAGLAVLLAALALLATAVLVRVDVRRPWAAAGWAMSPVLLVHWLSWELVAAVGVAVLLWGWTTGRAWLAGVGAGIGAAFALPVAVAFVGVVAVGGRMRDRVDALVAAAAAYVVVTLPGRGHVEDPDVGSTWLLLHQVGAPGSRTFRMTVSLVVLVVAAAAAVRVVRRAARPTVTSCAQVGLLMMVAALLVSPTAPPELALLALPLAALALRRWRDLLVWQGCQLVSWAITGWWLGDALAPTVTDDDRAYWLAILLRVVGLLWLAVAVLRDASADDDAVEVGRGEADPDLDLLADPGHPRA
ncbi:hypothetical protein ASC64_15510 [Nocardioides sp. Root122]|uniref:hypothetical protein n=1 Tax=Nocardioides TaxID=1839 RepID=UPI000703C25A|nr:MULTISPECIES: hypothetical protein [Nocardioides]KQV64190.1 hypothetical protein ASC64_15510 [Nocardioides sp. Root122]MCK9825188.1 hypothetical protein [Nocardioides cavernae]